MLYPNYDCVSQLHNEIYLQEIYPGQFQPSPSHKFIKLIESKGKLLRNYTQNIDTLEQVAGISNVIQCHGMIISSLYHSCTWLVYLTDLFICFLWIAGSFATATCMTCKTRVTSNDVKEEILRQVCMIATSSYLHDTSLHGCNLSNLVFRRYLAANYVRLMLSCLSLSLI